MEITKEDLELVLGIKLSDFNLEPIYDGSTCIGLSVQVIPEQNIKEINITGIIN